MERKTFRISFFLRKARLSKTGMIPIFARVSTSGLRQDFYIQCQVKPELWDQNKERATGRDKYCYQVNAYLDDYRARIVEAHRELLREGFEGNAIEIKNRIRNPKTSTRMFLAELAIYADKRQKEVGIRITQLTANKYHRILRYLCEYTKTEYKKDDILLSAVNHSYIDGFNTFVQTAHSCKHNGAINLLCCLKNFILYAIRNEWIEKNPFQHYKLKEEHNKAKDHLTKAELERMIAKPMPNERLERIRDVFAFCCYTFVALTKSCLIINKLQPNNRSIGNGLETTCLHHFA